MKTEFDLRERAEIVSLAQECAKSLKAQPLIDWFLAKDDSNVKTCTANNGANCDFYDNKKCVHTEYCEFKKISNM